MRRCASDRFVSSLTVLNLNAWPGEVSNAITLSSEHLLEAYFDKYQCLLVTGLFLLPSCCWACCWRSTHHVALSDFSAISDFSAMESLIKPSYCRISGQLPDSSSSGSGRVDEVDLKRLRNDAKVQLGDLGYMEITLQACFQGHLVGGGLLQPDDSCPRPLTLIRRARRSGKRAKDAVVRAPI